LPCWWSNDRHTMGISFCNSTQPPIVL
jgi:hypothetical protein